MELKRAGSQPSARAGPSAKAKRKWKCAPATRSGPPGHKHWHGASATTSMTHIAVQEAENGVAVTWLEKVTDEDYMSPLGDHQH